MDIEEDLTKPHLEYEPPKSVALIEGENDEDENDEDEEDKNDDNVDEIVKILNIRKEKGKQADLFCEYMYSSRWWCKIKDVLIDKEEMVIKYLDERGIDISMIGCKLPKKLEKVIEEEKEMVLKTCKLDHENYLNYSGEGNAGYCKFPLHFFEVKCIVCCREFTHEKITDGK